MTLDYYEELQQNIDNIINNNKILSLEDYNNLLSKCVLKNEFAAAVYIYDIIKKNTKPDKITYSILDKLHSKTIPINNKLNVPVQPNSLNPRRRIHKIMKGYYYSEKYNNDNKKNEIIKNIINKNQNILNITNRIKMAKEIKKKTDLRLEDIRLIITHLKRTKFIQNKIKESNNSIDKYFK